MKVNLPPCPTLDALSRRPRSSPRNLGELISLFYQHLLEMYGDEDLASIATAAVLHDLLNDADLTDPTPETTP